MEKKNLIIGGFSGYNFDQLKPWVKSINDLKTRLSNFQKPEELPLKRILTIDGKEYGFEPNLSQMSYGAYIDIMQFNEIAMDDNWPKIMSILYRPISAKSGNNYSIEPYDGCRDAEQWLDVSMDVHFGCMFFFINLSTDLLNAILNSTTMTTAVQQKLKQTLQKSGEVIQQLSL